MTRYRTGKIGMQEEERNARRGSIGGSDARIIMSGDDRAIERLWLEKRGESMPEDLSDVLLIQLGNITEPLNADWFEKETGLFVTNEQDKVFYPEWEFAHATLDGLVRETRDLTSPAIKMVEFKFMLPFNFSVDKAVEKYFPQCQHNMMVTGLSTSVLSIITGAGQYIMAEIDADIFYQLKMLEAEKDFWDCVQTGRCPVATEVVVPAIDRVKIVDMTGNNQWSAFADEMLRTKQYVDRHEDAKKGIKKLFPGDAKEAKGHGVTISLSKDGKKLINFDKDALKKAIEDGAPPPLAANENTKKKPAPRKKKAAAKPAAEAA